MATPPYGWSISPPTRTVTYIEGKDYAPLRDPQLNPWRDDREALPLKLIPGSRLREGEHLRVSWYHSMLIHDSQVTVCMAEPALYDRKS